MLERLRVGVDLRGSWAEGMWAIIRNCAEESRDEHVGAIGSASGNDVRCTPFRATDCGVVFGIRSHDSAGHRGERVEEVASEILSLLPAKFALAGLSYGGIVAMEILRRAPDRVTRIGLLDTNPLAETPQSSATYEPLIVSARAGQLEKVIETFMQPEFLAPGPQRAEILALVKEMGLYLGAEVFVRQARALQRRRDQQSTLRKCKVPALVLCGEHDSLTPVKRHSFMAELIPYAELKVIEGRDISRRWNNRRPRRRRFASGCDCLRASVM